MSEEKERAIFARNLNYYMKQTGKLQSDIITELHINKSTISTWCKGTKMPRMGTIQLLADYFGIKKSDLLEEDLSSSLSASKTLFSSRKIHQIPVLGHVSAGLPLYAEEQIEGYMYTDLNHGSEYFALKVKGDSMNAIRICDGDTIIVRKQPIVENGEIAVILVNNENATVKKFYRHKNQVTLVPQSTNPVHQPQFYDLEKTAVSIIGKVVKNEIIY